MYNSLITNFVTKKDCSVAQFSCKLTIAKTMWDAKGNSAKGKSKESRDINLALDNIKAQIIKHYQRISDREKPM